MGMTLLLASVSAFLAGAVAGLFRRPRAARAVSTAGAVLGGLLGAAAGLLALTGGQGAGLIALTGGAAGHRLAAGLQEIRLSWGLPWGAFALGLDALSAFFVLPVGVVTALAAVYAVPYERLQGGHGAPQGFWYNLLGASMLLVLTSRDALLFLLAWESMSLSSFFLVMTHGEEETTMRAGWTYLVAAHLGTSLLMLFFLLLGRGAGVPGFGSLAGGFAPAGALFLLALGGFGMKAGFVPLHVWLPEAHPAAPSPVSAVMSGVMIKTGLYGLLRALTLLGHPPAWWGWTLLGVGLASGLFGVLQALAQRDLKRLLAYSSVENVGIAALGLGLGLLGISYRQPTLAALGLAGGLLHALNHSLFKSLLFLGAGAVDCAAGTREIEKLGGLLKRLPVTGAAILLGATAIAGLPPLNGFVGELLIYLGAGGVLLPGGAPSAALAGSGLLAIGALALIGGLAAACFVRAFGIAFLGEARSAAAAGVRAELPWGMKLPMLLLAALCLAAGLLAPALLELVRPAAALLAGPGVEETLAGPGGAAAVLSRMALVSAALLGLILLAVLVRRLALARSGRQAIRAGLTWDCGYAAPTPRMQYTASSFARGITRSFQPLLLSRPKILGPEGYFPQGGSLRTEPRDPLLQDLFRPLFRAVAWAAGRLRWLQQGRVQVYVLYIALTVLVLLIWKLG